MNLLWFRFRIAVKNFWRNLTQSWALPGKYVNEPQRESMLRLVKRAKQAHCVDVRVRIDGQYEWFEADWIKHMRTPMAGKPK